MSEAQYKHPRTFMLSCRDWLLQLRQICGVCEVSVEVEETADHQACSIANFVKEIRGNPAANIPVMTVHICC